MKNVDISTFFDTNKLEKAKISDIQDKYVQKHSIRDAIARSGESRDDAIQNSSGRNNKTIMKAPEPMF